MKERIIQFGEGNFLRGFVDWFIQGLNDKTNFDSSVVVVQPLPTGMCDKINQCGCTYHLALRGIKDGEATEDISEIKCISRCLNPYSEYESYLALAHIPEMRFIFSNTTEAGIAFDESCKFSDKPAVSYPGKLTQLLFERYKSGLPGFIIIACELIDYNGKALLECVKKYIKLWELPEEFEKWLDSECVFCSSLVDRIVTGYPRENAQEFFDKIGKVDEIFDTAEIYHFWAISGMKGHEEELPLDKLGYNVVFADDISPYKIRKVRILNGAHTMTVLAAYLCGIETVGEFMRDPLFEKYINEGIYNEIIPATDSLAEDELRSFADAVCDRFRNPYIRHRCLDISLNSVSKFKERCLPSFNDYVAKFGKLPRVLTVAFAALIEFYKKGLANDNPAHIEFIKNHSVKEILENTELWGKNMDEVPGLCETIERHLETGIKNLLFPMVKINEKDNVSVNFLTGHKYADCDIAKGEAVIKYGYPIGKATQDIAKGGHVHTHNLHTALEGKLDYTYDRTIEFPEISGNTFMGYKRKDRNAGIRNEVWIIPTVGCINGAAKQIESAFKDSDITVLATPHNFGCSQLGDDHLTTQKVLKSLVNHPNCAAALVLGLGCENNNIDEFKKILGESDPERVVFLNAQDSNDEVSEGIEIVKKLCDYARTFKREPVPCSQLTVGLKCGGSDGLSGITANPLVGRFCNYIVQKGASCILTEVPEMFGAEHILMNRCVTEEIFNKAVNMINGFKDYFIGYGQPIYENPSPGNKKGGITTLEDKSLGCIQKGGDAPVVDVLGIGDPVTVSGLNLLYGPGNDMVAVTNLIASGAQLVLFTTGRGTPYGGVVPTLKVATNSAMAGKKNNWIDFDAESGTDEEFFSLINEIIEGKPAKNELYGYREISIFKNGVTL